jgi:hypothetical protein
MQGRHGRAGGRMAENLDSPP